MPNEGNRRLEATHNCGDVLELSLDGVIASIRSALAAPTTIGEDDGEPLGKNPCRGKPNPAIDEASVDQHDRRSVAQPLKRDGRPVVGDDTFHGRPPRFGLCQTVALPSSGSGGYL